VKTGKNFLLTIFNKEPVDFTYIPASDSVFTDEFGNSIAFNRTKGYFLGPELLKMLKSGENKMG
jgi:hypothetical protein